MKKSWIFIALSPALLLSGCKMVQNLDDMHDSTLSMGKTTESMNEQMLATNQSISEQVEISRRLEKGTQELAHMTEDLMKTSRAMYQDMRQGSSLTIRSERILEMERSTSLPAKIAEAGKYFMSFEFQLFKSFGADDVARIEDLKEQAIQEFFLLLSSYATDLDKLDPSSSNAQMQNLFALAAAMHQINPNEARMAKEKGLSVPTVLSILEESLMKKAQIERGELEATRAESQVLLNEPLAIYMLRLRTNFLSVMALDKLTGIGEANFFAQARMLFFRFDTDLKSYNLTQLTEYSHWLGESVRVREELKSLSIDPKIDSNVLKLWGNMDLIQSRIDATSAPFDRIHADAEKTLITAISALRN